jgi:hypothetical protein
MSAQHTPGPWVQHALMVSEAGQPVGRERDICHCGLGMRRDAHESEANAARIVQCVNAHDELLAALILARNCMASELRLPVDECVGGDFTIINAAIAKATGSQS